MKKYLRCVQGGSSFTAGKRYEIVNESSSAYTVKNDAGAVEFFTKKPDDHGYSYRDWFELEPEDSTSITVLPDESLGGVMREYREVKRKASVGELVKYVWPGEESHVDIVTDVDNDGCVCVESYTDDNGDEVSGYAYDAYVVLEPSDTLVIDGARYRMVDRKAAVGERVIVAEKVGDDRFEIGRAYEVVYADKYDDVWVKHPRGAHSISGGAYLPKYRVLELVETAATPQLSELPASDQIAENIAALAARVSGLESKVAELMRPVNARVSPEEPSASSAQAETWTKVASGPVDTKLPSYLSPQQIRDEIVERAKADVSDLRKFKCTPIPNDPNGIWFWPESDKPKGYIPMQTVEYVVNRDKRRVTAVIRNEIRGVVSAVGRAICAKNDVFNVHIGRAIALRRALGLEVPAEYLSVPNPTEGRPGDIVELTHNPRYELHMPWSAEEIRCQHDWVRILDDSREEVAA